MQNRFRFRAWFKPEYREPIMLYDIEQTYDFMRGEPENVPEDCFGDVLTNDNYIVMQCTGLKDKNEKLIYEGDIVVENWHGYVIGWNRGSFDIVDILSKKCYTISALCSEKSEVIGNIYENKELLNE